MSRGRGAWIREWLKFSEDDSGEYAEHAMPVVDDKNVLTASEVAEIKRIVAMSRFFTILFAAMLGLGSLVLAIIAAFGWDRLAGWLHSGR